MKKLRSLRLLLSVVLLTSVLAPVASVRAADLTVTAASVLASTAATKTTGIAGATITAGQVLYKASDNTMKLADANGASPLYNVAGIALHAAATGQPITYATADVSFTVGATVAIGSVYILSATPGGIAPVADNATGYFTTVLGVGISTTKINFHIVAAGAATP